MAADSCDRIAKVFVLVQQIDVEDINQRIIHSVDRQCWDLNSIDRPELYPSTDRLNKGFTEISESRRIESRLQSLRMMTGHEIRVLLCEPLSGLEDLLRCQVQSY